MTGVAAWIAAHQAHAIAAAAFIGALVTAALTYARTRYHSDRADCHDRHR